MFRQLLSEDLQAFEIHCPGCGIWPVCFLIASGPLQPVQRLSLCSSVDFHWFQYGQFSDLARSLYREAPVTPIAAVGSPGRSVTNQATSNNQHNGSQWLLPLHRVNSDPVFSQPPLTIQRVVDVWQLHLF